MMRGRRESKHMDHEANSAEVECFIYISIYILRFCDIFDIFDIIFVDDIGDITTLRQYKNDLKEQQNMKEKKV